MQLQPVNCRYVLYVDGSPGPKKTEGWSGWGAALMAGETPIYEACGVTAERVSTDAIELEALIQGITYLMRLHLPSVVTIYTDSQYVGETVAKLPLLGHRGFTTEKGKPIKNEQRIRLLHDLLYSMEMSQRCIIRWVKGHSGVAGNEVADKLSKQAAYHGEVFYRENPAQSAPPTS